MRLSGHRRVGWQGHARPISARRVLSPGPQAITFMSLALTMLDMCPSAWEHLLVRYVSGYGTLSLTDGGTSYPCSASGPLPTRP